jgi:hypothetical protein
MYSKYVRRVILLFLLVGAFRGGLIFAQDVVSTGSTSANVIDMTGDRPFKLAVYPLVSTGMPPSGTVGMIDPASLSSIINQGIITATRADFEQIAVTPPDGFDPSVPPDTGDTDTDGDSYTDIQGAKYSLTSQVFYDVINQQSQCQVWLFDNTTEALVITDQLVYPFVDSDVSQAQQDAQTAGPGLIDFVLSMIPAWYVNISVTGGGSGLIYEGDSPENEKLAGDTYIYNEQDSLTLYAKEKGLWSVFQGWCVNGNETLITDRAFTINLNRVDFPIKPSTDDPWGTDIHVTVEAVFTDLATESRPFSIGVNYSPVFPLDHSGDPFFSKPLWLSFTAEFGFTPWNKPWGSVGFLLGGGYMQGEAEQAYGSEVEKVVQQVIPAWLGVSYRTPFFFRFMKAEARLLTGAVLHLPPILSERSSSNYEGGWNWAYYLSPGLDLEVYVGPNFFFNLGANFDFAFHSNGIKMQIIPNGGIGFVF